MTEAQRHRGTKVVAEVGDLGDRPPRATRGKQRACPAKGGGRLQSFSSRFTPSRCRSRFGDAGTRYASRDTRKAFTLIELLAVMGIMAMMAAIAVVSYFGMTRGSAMRSAVSHLQSALLLARQSAIMHGRKTYVIFDQSTTNAYVLCRHEGTATVGSGQGMRGGYTDLSALSEDSTIYNLDTGEGSKIEEPYPTYDPATKEWIVQTQDSIWTGKNKYGWEIHPKTYLPRGFEFGAGAPAVPDMVIFNADGTTRDQPYDIEIYEKINPGHIAEITVARLTGFISVEFK